MGCHFSRFLLRDCLGVELQLLAEGPITVYIIFKCLLVFLPPGIILDFPQDLRQFLLPAYEALYMMDDYDCTISLFSLESSRKVQHVHSLLSSEVLHFLPVLFCHVQRGGNIGRIVVHKIQPNRLSFLLELYHFEGADMRNQTRAQKFKEGGCDKDAAGVIL